MGILLSCVALHRRLHTPRHCGRCCSHTYRQAGLVGPKQDEKERLWAALLQGMAMTAGLHIPNARLGRALVQAGWSELRFVRLMQARGDVLVKEVRRLASFLSSKSQTVDWSDIAQLLFNQEGEWAERHRRRIARDYYKTLYQQEKDASN